MLIELFNTIEYISHDDRYGNLCRANTDAGWGGLTGSGLKWYPVDSKSRLDTHSDPDPEMGQNVKCRFLCTKRAW